MPQRISTEEILTNPIYSMVVHDLPLLVRTIGGCQSENAYYVAEIIQLTEREFLREPNVSKKSLAELKETLTKLGLELNTTIETDLFPESFRTALQEAREKHEKNLTKLQQLAAPGMGNYKAAREWLHEAKAMLTPDLIGRLKDPRQRTVLEGRLKDRPIRYTELGRTLNISNTRVEGIERQAVRALKKVIRSDIFLKATNG